MHKVQNLLYWLMSALAGLGIALLVLWLRGDLVPTVSQTTHAAIQSYSQAVRTASPAVVNIYANKLVTSKRLAHITDPAIQRILGVQGIIIPTQRLERSLGSGVLVSEDGLILTNDHVIEGADEIQVLLADDREVAAEIVGIDKDTDLAVLRIPLNHLPFLKLQPSDTVQVGDIVLAIGNPFGLTQTVTQGIISALQRGGSPEAPLAHYLQTDAAINEGNSGGALVNTRGRLVGINVATLAGSQHVQGISFAIPSSLAYKVLSEILQYGQVRRGWLGIEADLNYAQLRSSKPGLPNGIRIRSVVSGSPAEEAGLQTGDILQGIDGFSVDARSDVMSYIAARKPGTSVRINWLHRGQRKEASVMLGQRPGRTLNSGSSTRG